MEIQDAIHGYIQMDEDNTSRKRLQSLENTISKTEKIENKIANEVDIPQYKVIVNPPSTPEIEEINIRIKKNGAVKNMSDISPLPDALTQAEWQTVSMDVYTTEDNTDSVRKASENILKSI